MNRGTLDPVSNQATWTDTIELYDDETGEPFDLGDVTAITMKLRDGCMTPALSGSLGEEIEIVGDDEDGVFEFTFSAGTMSNLEAKTYEVGILVTTATATTQLILGTVAVLEGL